MAAMLSVIAYLSCMCRAARVCECAAPSGAPDALRGRLHVRPNSRSPR